MIKGLNKKIVIFFKKRRSCSHQTEDWPYEFEKKGKKNAKTNHLKDT